jgi:predicted HicB family RNase H-like nuclease
MEEQYKLLNVRIPASLHKKMRVFAAEHEISIQLIISKSLEKYLEENKKK